MTLILKQFNSFLNFKDDTVADYSRRVGSYQKCAQLAAVHPNTWKRFVKNKDKPGDLTWHYFLLCINEHPQYQVENRQRLLSIDIHNLFNEFTAETEKPSPLLWVMWLIQRDLHPLYLLTYRRVPVVKTYDETILIGGLPETAYRIPDAIKQAQYNRSLYSEYTDTDQPLRPEEYIYGNNFADLKQYVDGNFVHPNTFDVVSAVQMESKHSYDFGTIDRLLKTRLIYGEVSGLGRTNIQNTKEHPKKNHKRSLGQFNNRQFKNAASLT